VIRPLGPEDYRYLSPDQIYDLSKERLKEARLAYKARYRRPCTAKEIDAEIDNLFSDWARGYFDKNDNQHFDPTIEVPPDLLLGLLLREGSGRGRGRLPRTAGQRYERYRKANDACKDYKRLRAERKRELIAAGKERSWAAAEAQQWALKEVSKSYGLAKNTILRPGRTSWRKRPTKRA
jgi:hypothetical protein